MRRLFNAYGEWYYRMDSGDTFDTLLAMVSFVGLASGAILLLVAVILVPLLILTSHTADTHGSCKVGHHQFTGKTTAFVCDEYYPLPQVRD